MINREFLDDKPINKSSDDLLGFTEFAQNIVNMLNIIPKNECFNFGLCGEWGSGKTSIMNLCLEHIEKNNSFNVIHFRPWNVIKKENLITEFFELLKNAICRETGNKKILKQLSNYYEILVDSIPSDSFFVKLFKNITSKSLNDKATVKAQKEKIISFLKNEYVGKPILIMIDDLDRLTNDEICEVLKLIREIADFPSVIYFVIYENKQVVNAIENELKINSGEEYLRKFFQIKWSIPVINNEKIKRYLLNLLQANELCKDMLNPETEEYFHTIFDNCISEYVKNIRDIKLLFNSFIVRFSLLIQWVNLVDLLALTCFELFKPELYSFIYKNRLILTSQFGEISGIREKIENMNVQNEMGELFPKVYYLDLDKKKKRSIKNRNICSSIFCDSYFYQKNETTYSISKEHIRILLNEMTFEDMNNFFVHFFNGSVRRKALENIFMEISQEIESISLERKKVFFRMMFILGNNIYAKKNITFDRRNVFLSNVMEILTEILRNISQEESYNWLTDFLFDECNLLYSYKFVTYFLNTMKIFSNKHLVNNSEDLFFCASDLNKFLEGVRVIFNKNYAKIQLFDESYIDSVFEFYVRNFPDDINMYYKNVISQTDSLIHMCLHPTRTLISQNLDGYLKIQFPEIESLTNRSEEIARYINDGKYQNLPNHLKTDFVNFIKQMNITKEMLSEKEINLENWTKLYKLANS